MNQEEYRYPSIRKRSYGRKMFCWNAFFWGLGNGLISTSLVVYIVRSLSWNAMDSAKIGLAISWIIAAPRLIGLLRIFTPSLIDWTGSRKAICLTGYFLSPLILLLLPLFVPWTVQWSRCHINTVLCLVGCIWGIYHLVEYFATVSLWSRIGDFVPGQIRVRFLAQRERAMIAGQFPGMLIAGLYAWYYKMILHIPTSEQWVFYLPPTFLGIIFLLSGVVPLIRIDEIPWKRAACLKTRFFEILVPFRLPAFLPFLMFGVWIQIANGLTQSPQSLYQMNVLEVTMLTALLLQSWTRIGQMFSSGITAHFIDRYGNYPVIAVALLIVALGPLCYMLSTAVYWQWIILAATLWIGWIGVNIGINNLTLSLAPPSVRSSAIALYFTMTTLAFGLATMVGGSLFDLYSKQSFVIWGCRNAVSYYTLAFLAGWFLRCGGLFFLYWGWKMDKVKNTAIEIARSNNN